MDIEQNRDTDQDIISSTLHIYEANVSVNE